jgi:hypothetical protein
MARAAELEDRVIDTPAATVVGLLAQARLAADYAGDHDDDTPTARSARAVVAGLERLAGEADHA